MLSDKILVEKYCRSRSREIFGLIVARHGAMVLRVGHRLLGDQNSADDAAQVTFQTLAKHPEVARRSLADFLHRTTRGCAAEVIRAREKARRAVKGKTSEIWDSRPAGLRGELDAAIDKLPAEQREAVILQYLEGRSPGDSALMLGCPEVDVQHRSAQGLRTLQEELYDRGLPCKVGTLTAYLAGEADAGARTTAEVVEPLMNAIDRAIAVRPEPPKAKVSLARPTISTSEIVILVIALAVTAGILGVTAKDWGKLASARADRGGPSEVVRRLAFGKGFTSLDDLTANGFANVPVLSGQALRLTDDHEVQAHSIFHTALVDVRAFKTAFRYRVSGNRLADGFTFCIQGVGPTAVGKNGHNLGYGGIARSVAVKFDLYGEPTSPNQDTRFNTTGLYLDGAMPTDVGSIELTGAGIELRDGATYRMAIDYDGAELSLKIADVEKPSRAFSRSFRVDVPKAVGGPTAYVGFTGGTGGNSAIQDILSWTFRSVAPSSTPRPPDLTAGLIHRYTFDEAGGTIARDSAGSAEGTLNQGPTRVVGRVGSGALAFNGVDQFVSVPDVPDCRFTKAQSFTISAWINISASSLKGRWSGLATKSREDRWYGLALGPENQWSFVTFFDPGPLDIFSPATAATGWHLATAVQDGPANLRTLYVDGAPVVTGPARDADGPGDLWIGAAKGVDQYFEGMIDDVRIYNRALGPDEVGVLASTTGQP